MQDTTLDPLAKVRNPDGTIYWLAVGEAEQARRDNRATSEMIAVLDWLHANGGTYYVVRAAQQFADHCVEQVRQNGGTIVTRTTRNGRTTTMRRTYPAPRTALAPARVRSCSRTARPRERRTGASSASSSSDPGDGSSDPPPAQALRLTPGWAAEWSRRASLRIEQVAWCGRCRLVAPAIDDYQRAGLDAIAFGDRDCRCQR